MLRLAPTKCWLSITLASAILLIWLMVAFSLDQSILATQRSRQLLSFGALNLEMLHQWWRLATSQFLHVHFLHMLFNAMCVMAIGSIVEQRYGTVSLAVIYLVGGAVGLLASVWSYPVLINSGASQAIMALCGAGLIGLYRTRGTIAIAAIVLVQAALDIYVANKIKAGHSTAFIAGLIMGYMFHAFIVSRRSAQRHNVSAN
jgi:rhomboid protease GluP